MLENDGATVTVNTVSRNTEIGRAERFEQSEPTGCFRD